MAGRFTADPGTDTWAFKTAKGAAPDDNLTENDLDALESNNLNYYTTTSGGAFLTDGRAASGVYLDETRGLDALSADMAAEVLGLLKKRKKVPFTRRGISS